MQGVYIETSVISYLTARPSRDLIVAAHQEITRQWWESERVKYSIYTSEAVIREAAAGDALAAARRTDLVAPFSMLDIDMHVEELAGEILRRGAMPPQAALDALHVAVAAWHGVDYLLTWNCRHIASAHVRPRVEAVCRQRGIKAPQFAPICADGRPRILSASYRWVPSRSRTQRARHRRSHAQR